MHFDLSTTIAIGFVCYLIGVVSTLILTNKEIKFEKQVALVILTSWMSFAIIAYLQDKELSIFFNSAGLGAVGNLLGIKTAEAIGGIIKRK